MNRRLSLLLEAIRGSDRDYTTGAVGPALVMLAIPMVLEMSMESLFAVVDVFYVSRVSADAVATVGITESMLTIVYTVALGLGIGATAVVSRRTGEKNDEGAIEAAAQSIALGIFVALAIGVCGYLNAERLLRLMGATPSMIGSSLGYTQVMLAGNVTVTLLFLNNAIFRGAGDPAIAMRMLWLGNAINIAVCPLLIFGIGPFPHLGVAGAALGTNIGRGTAVVTQLWMLTSGRSRVHIKARHMRLIPSVMWNVCRLSGSGFVQILIDTSSYIGLIRILSTFGPDALAGYTIAFRMMMFALMPAWGLGNAAATMVGQALGARLPDRAETSVWTAGKYNAIVLGLVEGVTEYLPISSTGHLLITARILDLPTSGDAGDAIKSYEIAIQFGAILAVLVLYRARVWAMAEGIVGRSVEGRRSCRCRRTSHPNATRG